MKLDDLRKHLQRPARKPKSQIKQMAERLSTMSRRFRSAVSHCDCDGQLPTTFYSGNWFCEECVDLMKARANAGANLCDLCLSSDVTHHGAGTRPFPLLCIKCQDLDWEEDHKP